MKTLRFLLTALVLCGAASFAQSVPNAVSILVTITGTREKSIIPTTSTLKVKANHARATVVSLTPLKDTPLTFVLLLDISGSQSDKMIPSVSHQEVSRIFAALAAGKNRGYFGIFNRQLKISPRPLTPAEVNALLKTVAPKGTTALNIAVMLASKSLRKWTPSDTDRRALIVISDGADNQSGASLDQTCRAVQVDGVPVFTVNIYKYFVNPYGYNSESEWGREALKVLSNTTGGRPILIHEQEKILPELLNVLDSQYLLTFVPSKPVHDGKLHPLRVKSSQKGLDISAPAHYLAR